MARKNEKTNIINYENSISQSNEFSMAKLNHGLTLNQMQLLAFAIYCTQKNGVTEFRKVDFEKKFGIEKYQTAHAKQDAQRLIGLQFSIENLENHYFDYMNVFQRIKYDNGLFIFKWSEDMVPHILNLKDKYNLTDLTMKSKFKSGFSWTLYDYLKGLYGYWHKQISKDALLRLFSVEDKKTYQNTAQFKRGVLDVAIREINAHTELEVFYREIKKGRAIVGFDIHWSSGITVASATEKQIKELKTIVDAISDSSLDYLAKIEDKQNRERAAELIREVVSYDEFTSEPICITQERANELIQKSNLYLRELEQMVQYEQEKPRVPFYNWLEIRES